MKAFKKSFIEHIKDYNIEHVDISFIITFLAHLCNTNKYIKNIEKKDNNMYKINIFVPYHLRIYKNDNNTNKKKNNLDINKLKISSNSSIDCKNDKFCMIPNCSYKHPQMHNIKIIILLFNYLYNNDISAEFLNNIKKNCKKSGLAFINQCIYNSNVLSDEESWTTV